MRSRIQTVVIPSVEASEFAAEIRALFQALGRTSTDVLGGEHSPALDVYETDTTVEIAVDLPGVNSTSLRLFAKGQAILIAGDKSPRRGSGDSNFHLVERGFGRFARVILLPTACDTSRARAHLQNGELHVTLPKITERRGQTLTIPLDSEPA